MVKFFRELPLIAIVRYLNKSEAKQWIRRGFMGKPLWVMLIVLCSLLPVGCGKTATGSSPYANVTASGSADTVLSGKWILYQYQIKGEHTIIPRSDTLEFISGSDYRYNQFLAAYRLYTVTAGYRLSLNNTPFGDITGILPYNAPAIGEVNGSELARIWPQPAIHYLIWLKRL